MWYTACLVLTWCVWAHASVIAHLSAPGLEIYIYIYIHIYIYMYVCMYVCKYVYLYESISIHSAAHIRLLVGCFHYGQCGDCEGNSQNEKDTQQKRKLK